MTIFLVVGLVVYAFICLFVYSLCKAAALKPEPFGADTKEATERKERP